MNPHYLSLVTFAHTSTWADAFLCSETYRDIALWLDHSFLIGMAGVAVATPGALALAVSSVTMLWVGGAAPLCSASTDAMPRVGDSLICCSLHAECVCARRITLWWPGQRLSTVRVSLRLSWG